MKKISKYIIIFLSGIFIFSSCSEDVLDTPALGKILEGSKEFKLSDVNSEALSLYNPIMGAYRGQWGTSTYVALNVASDDASGGGASAGDRPEYEACDKFSLDANNGSAKGLFERFYKGIYLCNQFLFDYGSLGSTNDSLLRNVAEAKFLRAFYYFNVVNIFGSSVLATLPSDPATLPNMPVADFYALMEKDLTEAIPYLPATKAGLSVEDKNITRATALTARALLGKIYVFHSTVLGEDKWALAKAELDAVKNSGDYSLVPNFRSLWSSNYEQKDGNPESILEAPYTDAQGANWNGGDSYMTGNLDMQLMGVRDLLGYTGVQAGWGFCKPTQKLVDQFISEEDSIRLDATVMAAEWKGPAQTWEAAGKLLPSIKTVGGSYSEPYDVTGYWNGKYRLDENPANSTQYAQNEMIMRYAEVLLLLAETEYRLGNESAALALVNQIRARVNLSAKASSGAALWADIVKEKQMELAMESVRFLDLKRWGTAKDEIPGWNSTTNGLWPFPLGQLSVDKNLVQNPGY